MEVSVTGLSSSSTPPTKPFVTQKPSVSDENEHYYQQMGSPNLSNPKKSMNKHYMSPTISAASKAVSSRRNILGERNEAFESTLSTAHVRKANPLTPESHNDDHNDVSEELSSRPYDPVTNYLSPRPQFLRYKPSRRRDILLRLENSIAEGNDGLSFSRSGSFESQKAIDEEVGSVTTSSSSLASYCKQEDEDVEGIGGKAEESDGEIKEIVEAIRGIDIVSEGIDEGTEGSDEEVEESDDEDEEFEEEKKGWSFKGVLKNLILLLVLVLLTSHISSMNQETHFEGVEEGDLRSQNHTVEADLLKKHESGESSIWDNRGERQMSIVEGIKGAIEIGIEEGEVVEAVEHHSDFYDSDEEVMEEMKVEREDLGALEHAADDLREVFEIQAEEIEVVQLVEGEEGKGVAEDTEEVSDQMVENSELHVVATPVNDESFELNQTPLMSDDASSASDGEGEVAVESIEEKDTTAELVMSNTEDNASNASNGEGEAAVESIEEMDMTAEVVSNTMDNDYTGLDDEVLDFGAEESWREKVLNYMIRIKPKSFYTTPIVGVSILSVAAVSLALVFFFRRMKGNKDSIVIANTGSMKTLIIEQKKNIGIESSLPLKMYSESVISERYNSAVANKEEDDSIYSSFRRMSLSSNSKHSTEAGSEEYHRKAPTIELLGEFVVGEVSSPLQSYGMRKSLMREGEQSNYAISSEKKFRSQVHSISVQQQPSATEFSSMDSFSNGSYTSEKLMKEKETEVEFSSMDTSHGSYTSEQIVRKLEGGKNGEVKLIATPVRRSSRIRSKTVMSP